jgi:glycosyltransferase involved in cell wall biosynthesis
MKICHIIANLYAGGAQTFVVLLAVEQQKLGHEVSVILIDQFNHSTFEKFLIQQLKENQIPVYSLDRKPGKNFSIFNSFFELNTLLKKLQPHIINSHLQFTHLITSLYLKIFRKKYNLVLTIHNAPEVWNYQTLKLNLNTPSIYCSKASLETSINRDCKKLVIANGIKQPVIEDSAIQILKDYDVNSHHQLVLMVGKLSHQKNYPLAVEIAKHYENENVSFLICGIKEETADADLASFETVTNIKYLGIKNPKEIHSLMDKCDVFLNTSHYEGLPITVLEAFFVGTPCVLSNILPHHEIGDGLAEVYIPKSFAVADYVSVIDLALLNKSSKKVIQNNREPHLAPYSVAKAAQSYVDFYEKVIG